MMGVHWGPYPRMAWPKTPRNPYYYRDKAELSKNI